MLPKSERLSKSDFQGSRPKVFFRGAFFDVAYLTEPIHKAACVISKKTLKRAVDRNFVKRRIMNNIATHLKSKNYSYIIYPKKIILTTSRTQLQEEIRKAFDTL